MVAIAGVVIGAIGLISSILTAANQTEAAKYAVDRQMEIANRVQAREDEFYRLWVDEYLTCELDYVYDVFREQEVNPDTRTVSVRAAISVKRQFARAESDALRCLPVYCVGAASGVRRSLQLAEASAAVWASASATRTEEERAHMINTRLREELWRTINIGHGAYFDTNGSAVAAEAFGRLGRASERAAGEASNAAGYFAQQLMSRGPAVFSNRPTSDPLLDNRSQGPPAAVSNVTINNSPASDSRNGDALFSDRDVGNDDWGL